ncbi:DNA-binding transcriptional LysR family regulator [Saccharopolyspora erythraea NRRL 2338]|uniref:LysR family transcriptional regulator n=2 Tax=Saccharopolyspora erythraea TaxID=1836 RepID=A0ABN1DK05_SACER|nr:LysR family transcriptional regulator [Saccharopolyspora erythraea]EQD87294.1 transcriptional regulator [Saccharopolyspora erythraea D]PFG93500.1 DNA-binding transcriptional LysR family regulator [Saccharopolyspora erythraea NRRL 2338]QRK90362.1 LysR family transcriptional regulator [Saccharopolyspora erythraea]CAL99697.1 probable transcriptional regulator, LysR family [Saccharopolyspora erythraea NRRL 2338]
MVDPRYIRMFHEVVATGSYSAAARSLGYSQPAVSRQMRALERCVGTPLFVRVGRAMRLTEAGEVLARHAESVTADLAAAQNQISAIADLRAGTIRICAFPSASATIVPAATASATRAHPGLRIRLVEDEPPGSLETLRRGECDIALAFTYPGFGERPCDDVIGIEVLEDPVVAVLPTGHRLSRRRSLDLAELRGERWIAGCPRCRDHFVRACAAAGFEPDIAFTTDDNLAVQSLVAAGTGIALMPRLVLSFLKHPRIVGRRVRRVHHRSISAYVLRDHRRIPATALMLETFRRVGEQMRREP